MFKRILVGVDSSPQARRGLETAVRLAAGQRALLLVLHVIDELSAAPIALGPALAHPFGARFIDVLRENGRRLLAGAERLACARSVACETVMVDTGGEDVSRALLTQARLMKADLVVLGTHGRRGLHRLVMGSDAEGVLRESKVPVLLVRDPASHRSGRRSTRDRSRTIIAMRPATGTRSDMPSTMSRSARRSVEGAKASR